MKSWTYIILVLVCLVFPSNRANASSYQVYFHYDQKNGFLTFDESRNPPIVIDQNQDISPIEFEQSESKGSFAVVFRNHNDEEIARKNFEPTTEKFVFGAPYYTFAKSLEIFRSGVDKSILSVNLSQFSTCDHNGVCEYEKGENLDTCLSDCTGTSIAFSDETKSLLNQNNGIVRDPKTGSILLNDLRTTDTSQNAPVGENPQSSAKPFWLTILFVVGLAGAAGAAVYFILRREE